MLGLVLVLALCAAPLQQKAEEQYAYVAALAQKGLNEQLAREAQGFLRAYPEHPKADTVRYRLGCALFELQRERDAAPVFQELARRADFEFAAEVQFRLGQCLLGSGEREAAEQALARVLAARKEYLAAPTLALLAQSELARKDHEHALEHFEKLLARKDVGDYAADARCGRAWCLKGLGRASEAAQAARAALASAPPARAGEMSFLLGESLLDAHDAQGALEAFSNVREGSYADAALRGSGFAHVELGDSQGAAKDFGALLERFPKSPLRAECALQRGVALLRAGDAPAAVQAFSSPDCAADADTLAWRARAQDAAGDKQAALSSVERALALHPSAEREQALALQRAELLAALGRGAEAQRIWERVGDDRALLAASVAALSAKHFTEAADLAGRMLERFPQSQLATQARLARAEGCYGAGQWKEAEAAFASAAQSDTDPARALRARSRGAWCAYQSGEFARAAQAFDTLAQGKGEAPEIEEACFMAARAREDAGDAAAAQGYERYGKRFPRGAHAEEASLRGVLLAPAGTRCERLAALEGHFGEGALAARVHYERAWCLYQAKQYADSARELETVLGNSASGAPLEQAGRELAVWCALQQGDLEHALAGWRELARTGLDEERAGTLVSALAAALSKSKREADARAVVSEFGKSARTPAGRARAAFERAELSDPAHALELYDAAAQEASSPIADRALYKAGFARLSAGDSAGAQRCFQKLVDEHAQSEFFHESLFLLGEAQFREGQFEKAAANLERVRREAPRHPLLPKVLFRLGLAQGELGRWKESAEVLGALLRANPDFANQAEAELGRGRALGELGDARGARVCFERVLALDQGVLSARAHLELGRLDYSASDLDGALAEFLKVAVLYAADEEVAEALVLAGRVLEDQKQPDKALEQYREVLAKHGQARYAGEARKRLDALGSR
ncbi:MAG: tetratricopeptide repeat protein [Planctomycetes bacterium]|nr:tetratricopeptide repeat protein [Planctomycetota bacterium]